jgi:flagellar M-ring protein FliF
MDAMKRLFEHFYGVVGRMAPSQILLAAIVVVGMVVGTIMIVSWAKDQYFAPLYTGLSSEDAGKIVERLTEMKIQYQIGDNGSSISVPSNNVYETRMKLATAGLPSPQNIGYALLDQTNIGMTDFLQKVNYRRVRGSCGARASGDTGRPPFPRGSTYTDSIGGIEAERCDAVG